MMDFPAKTANASRLYSVDWSQFLESRTPATAALSAVTYVSDPTGLMFSGQAISGDVASVTISAGIAGVVYRIIMKATLDNGEIEERSVELPVVRHKP